MNLRVASGAFCLAMLVLLSGCLGGSEGTTEDPEIIAEQAMKAFGASAGTQDGGDIKRLSGSFEATQPATDGSSPMPFEDATIDMTFEWGKDDIVHLVMGVASGGMTFNLEAWCSPTQSVFQWGKDIYASRPAPPGAPQDDEICGDMEGMEDPSSGLDMFDQEAFEGIEMESIETHSDGSITATFTDAGNNSTMTATIDSKGRVSRIAMESPEGHGAFDITYGKRDTITIPEANQRLPADIDWHTEVGGGAQTMTITSSPVLPPLDEIEARLTMRDWENDETTVVVAFPTNIAGPQSKDGYTFEYQDRDDDGRVSENDTWRFSHPDWEDSWSMEESPDLFDTWAGKSVSEGMMPAPGAALILALGALALLGVARRR